MHFSSPESTLCITSENLQGKTDMHFYSPFPTRYTFSPKEGKVNAIFLEWPVSGTLVLGEPQAKLGETQVKDNTPHSSPLEQQGF